VANGEWNSFGDCCFGSESSVPVGAAVAAAVAVVVAVAQRSLY